MITLQLDIFEGPLDLLLYLIKKDDLEISRVSLAKITDQYLKYLDTLRELDIDVASEFLYLAAELTHIKSKTLLPDVEEEAEEEDDVVDDLVSRLKEYEQYKLAAAGLKQRPWLNRDIFARGSFSDLRDSTEGEETDKKDPDSEFFEIDTFTLVKTLSDILDRLPKEDVRHHVDAEHMSVTARLYEILECLKSKDSMLFEELFAGASTRGEVVLTFLALLEMAKLKMVRVYQSGAFEPIRLQRRIEIGEEVFGENEKAKEEIESYK